MSFDFRSPLLIRRPGRGATLLSAAALLVSTTAMEGALAAEPADVCPALRQIVAAADFRQLHDAPAAQLPGLASPQDCRTTTYAFDCHWHAHWPADGVINDPLEEMGADIAACLPNVIHDVNTPTHQHFVVTGMERRVSVTASIISPNELRLLVTR